MSLLEELSRQIHGECMPEEELTIEDENDSPLSVIIKEGQLDVNRIKEYEGDSLQLFEFRPTTFEQFIGQTEAKERGKTIIKRTEKGLKAHFLVDGIKGHGKTTFVELIANSLDAHIIKRIGKQVNIDNIVDIINEIHDSDKKYNVLFIDEIDTMDKGVIKCLNPIIESFEIAGKKIRPFIFACATINKHVLIKNNPDTLDRITTKIKFIRYNDEEIRKIINQYVNELYSEENIDDDAVISISQNCKYNPRTAIALLEDYIVEEDIDKVLKNCNIKINGLTSKDLDILEILLNSSKPMGAKCLALKCGMSEAEYLMEFEPFLLEYDYINRVPSRVITEKGKELIRCLN